MSAGQVVLLLSGFYPLRNHDHIHVVSHGNDALNDGGNPVIGCGFRHKASIEFYLVGGQIPKGSTGISSSQADGTRARNRILYAQGLKKEDDGRWVLEWNYELPSEWGAALVNLQSIQGPVVEALCWYNGADPRSSTRVWLSLQSEGPDEPLRSVWLSTILAHFDTRPYDVLWMACRSDD